MSDPVYFFYWAPAVLQNAWIPLTEPLGSAELWLKNTAINDVKLPEMPHNVLNEMILKPKPERMEVNFLQETKDTATFVHK